MRSYKATALRLYNTYKYLIKRILKITPEFERDCFIKEMVVDIKPDLPSIERSIELMETPCNVFEDLKMSVLF